ncbi:DivIVA domain-containing protein [Phycicoccus sonneratiae]|uniref:Cell wall synthesis protein Wag31 n=1 Tax=Phycicoccus sonneratiae TaxID=2807628 RepID=A0ABS2CRL0_9MICO|nr:DivIVA domain-containing protein [Phycicoccus sonneraticus]MBM6402513.1 DivIVA domain-containing protein [Phycicoccus sonneraticus]
MLTPEDVQNTHFTQTQFREGYDEREVDDLLDEVVATLRHLDGSSATAPRRPLTAAAVRDRRLSVTSFRRGYDVREVDALLARVADALAEREASRSTTATGKAASDSRPVTVDPAFSATPGPREGLGARLLRVLRGDPRR